MHKPQFVKSILLLAGSFTFAFLLGEMVLGFAISTALDSRRLEDDP